MTTPSNSAVFGELLRDVDRVLPRHRVDHEQDVVRPEQLLEVRQLLHQLLVDVKAAGGVDDQHVLAVALRLVQRPAGDVARVAVGALLVDRRADLLPELDELVDRGRPVDVAGCERHLLAVLGLEEARELGARPSSCPSPGDPPSGSRWAALRRSATCREDSPISWVSSSLTILTTCWPGFRRLQHVLAEGPLLQRRRELLHDLEVDVRLQQREPDLAHRLVDVVLVQLAARADVGEDRLELVGEGVEHRTEG